MLVVSFATRSTIRLSHVFVFVSQITEVLGHHISEVNDSLHFWMPCISYGLEGVLNSPAFSPYPLSTLDHTAEAASPFAAEFVGLARSLLFQLISAMAYLHDPQRGVAHRDIKPANILITDSGYVKLIDFGVSWCEHMSASSDCLWPEPRGGMCFDVSTG